MSKTDNKKKAMIEALTKSLGVVVSACRIVDIGRATHYRWMRSDEEYKQEVEDIQDVALDFAESELFKQIRDGSTSATIFYLKCKGREKRGYYEKQQHDLTTGDEPIQINIIVDET